MVVIRILFVMLGSFFNVQAGLIVADKTTVIINPSQQTVEIIQENLFGFVQTKEEKILIQERWDKLYYWKEKGTTWVELLDNFPNKDLYFQESDHSIQATIKLKYKDEKDLEVLGIWYNDELKKFSINNKTDDNIVAPKGTIKDQYIYFEADSTFSFSLTPFINLPKDYQKHKIPLEEILEN